MVVYQVITKKMTREEAEKDYGINSWGNWSCDAETFDWSYSDTETCYLFEGAADILYDGEKTHIEKGMLVQFPAGLSCVWQVSEPISKAYYFGTLNIK